MIRTLLFRGVRPSDFCHMREYGSQGWCIPLCSGDSQNRFVITAERGPLNAQKPPRRPHGGYVGDYIGFRVKG